MSGPKVYANDFEIHLGHITTKGSLFPLNKSKPKGKGNGSYGMRGPELQPVEQVFRDSKGQIFIGDDCLRVKINEDKTETEVNTEAIKQASKATIQKNHMFLSFFSNTDVGVDVWPAKELTSYVFVPSTELPSYEQIANVLARKLNGKVIALAEVNLRGHQNLYRLVARDGHLVMQPVAYTNTLNEFPKRNFKVPAKEAELFGKLIDMLTVEWDADEHSNVDKVDRIRLAEAVKIGSHDAAELFQVKAEVEPDLLSQLQAALMEVEA